MGKAVVDTVKTVVKVVVEEVVKPVVKAVIAVVKTVVNNVVQAANTFVKAVAITAAYTTAKIVEKVDKSIKKVKKAAKKSKKKEEVFGAHSDTKESLSETLFDIGIVKLTKTVTTDLTTSGTKGSIEVSSYCKSKINAGEYGVTGKLNNFSVSGSFDTMFNASVDVGMHFDDARVYAGVNAGFEGPIGLKIGWTNKTDFGSDTTNVDVGIPGWLFAFGIGIYKFATEGQPIPQYIFD